MPALHAAVADIPDPAAPAAPEAGRAHPTSFAQRRFWVLDRLDPGNPALNVAVRWRIEGDLSTGQIAAAFERIIARHEVLRTCFIERDGEPVQVVREAVPFHVPSIDLTVLDSDAMAECDRIARAEARTPFDLAVAPLIRVTHLRLRADLAIIAVTAHHAVCDGWSIGLLAAEMCEICGAAAAGRAPALPELPFCYGDFAAYEREALAAGDMDADVAYWASTLRGIEPAAPLPDVPAPPAPAGTSAIESILLPPALTDALTLLQRQHGCTAFMVALAALGAVLARYTGATDIAVGTQVAGRDDVAVEDLVGVFINTLVLRLDLSGEPDAATLLARVREVVAGALAHRTVPFERILEAVRPGRHRGQAPLFAVNFIFQRSFIRNADCGAFRLIDLPSHSAGALHDLNFFMVERPEGWRASCEYRADLYAAETISQILRHFATLMSAMAAAPRTPVWRLPMLDAAERWRLVEGVNATAASYPRGLTAPAMVAAAAAAWPARIAVAAPDATLSYGALAARIDSLARRLLAAGIAPGSRVGIYLPRCADLVVAPLAVMRAGGAYVPLDPIYPPDRIAQIAEQAGLAAVIASADGLPQSLAVLPMVSPGEGGADTRPLPTVPPDATAYVIFTSGSTGRPKGVAVPHRALTNFLCAMRQVPGLAPDDGILAVTTLCFDIAALELFLPLTVGARVEVATEEESRDGALLLARLRASGATMLQATPATWRLLLAAGWAGDPPLRMLSGGEPLPPDLAHALLARSPELWNMYGPTETTIWSSAVRLDPEAAPFIGPPIANTRFYVVDPRGELAPPGAPGELWIGGDGVASGYWNMPEATRERFLSDPFGNTPGARVYRTGDRVRARRTGGWEFLGRGDDQVKIRGFRVEPAEVEALLLRHPAVSNAVVVARRGEAGDDVLVAYVALAGEAEPVIAELRAAAAAALPRYMRPSAIVALDAIPLLPNGKIDRRALPRPGTATAATEAPGGPEDVVEAQLAAIWRAVLGCGTFDRTADFFDLGGHSLSAARMLARVETAFGLRIGFATLFESARFVEFAERLREAGAGSAAFPSDPAPRPGEARPGIFAINHTGVFRPLLQRLGASLPITPLQLFNPERPTEALPASVEEAAAGYAALIRNAQPSGPYVLMGWCSGGVIAFETARHLERAGEQVSRVVMMDAWRPGYTRGLGLVRGRLAEYSYRLQLVAADWREVRAHGAGIRVFLGQRRIVSRLLGLRAEPGAEGDRFDRWLAAHLARALDQYRPTPFAGAVTMFRSSREPSGRFLDPLFGWGGLAAGGIEVVTVQGDHFSIFGEPGVSIMAAHLMKTIGRETAKPDEDPLGAAALPAHRAT
ncbi:non-ribosomal peptide synthetase [Paracraurococcus lichenis]|uniref:Amino acid adenylation domain-containing protein n=1 Tax=Paracraurococcus lichenis TaxID=3064888 RepID=A0ABT9E8T6_9PROT|nr:amino acid adenylation domain-containing protein [Paracraurococcus sp. LOR1-02]MDO9712576.1 amino acid adenylation domain-containing protein [Paracraurococcus sp. LOR1-02]